MTEVDARCAALLRAALDRAAADRLPFVERECAGDMAMLASMRALLAFDEDDWDLLDAPLEALAADLFGNDFGSGNHEAGQLVGPYRLVRELGRGGMGSVWLAARADGQFAQHVALKLIKLGMDSAHVQSQFRRERQLLARLQHPNIAQLIDGGVDERGRPWFAMEYIDGKGLHAWVNDCAPDLRRRLLLFVKLCRAVAHAHAQLVVHRDLKPSNVLVQADDEPRLLDFGIAKLVEHDDAEQTATLQRFLSRDYAAPEQLRGQPVSTATDVYALGLLLFELLTGLRYRTLHKDGVARLRPSSALAAGATAHPTHIARVHLRGDLDAIMLRALSDDPARRYPGAQALADDLQRHLDGKPVEARPDGWAYRSAKFVRRNRAAVSVAALALVALLVVSGVALWQAHAKVQEAERARIALKRSEAIRDFIQSVFLGADPLRGKGVDTTAGELLQAARGRVEHDLDDEPEIAAALLDQIGNTYVSIGADDLARETLREALAFNARAARPSLRIEASAGGRMAYYAYSDGHSEQALGDLDRLIDKLRSARDVTEVLAKTLELRSSVLYALDRTEESLGAQREAVALWAQDRATNSVEHVTALVGYADLAAALGRGAEAMDAAERALADPLLDGAAAPPALRYAAVGVKARALQALRRDAEAELLLREVIAGQTSLYGADAPRTRYWRFRRGEALHELGRLDEAQTVIDDLLTLPPEDAAPYRRVRIEVHGAAIALARNTADADARVEEAVIAACGKDGKADLCDKARALRATR